MNKEEELSPQQKANQNQNEKRRGKPYFAAVRLTGENEKDWLNSIIKNHTGTRKEALIEAFKLLEKKMKKRSK